MQHCGLVHTHNTTWGTRAKGPMQALADVWSCCCFEVCTIPTAHIAIHQHHATNQNAQHQSWHGKWLTTPIIMVNTPFNMGCTSNAQLLKCAGQRQCLDVYMCVCTRVWVWVWERVYTCGCACERANAAAVIHQCHSFTHRNHGLMCNPSGTLRPLKVASEPKAVSEPVFRFCKSKAHSDILIPIFHFYMKVMRVHSLMQACT